MKIIVLFLLLTFSLNAQQIANMSDFQPHYNVNNKEISLCGGNPNILKQFLHELGHHIWCYGGVDTTAYKEKFYMFGNISELFAVEHYLYFMNMSLPYSKEVFDNFYNRGCNETQED